ncbi:MAG: hypothetical protein U0559_09950 [Anaerolineae bacterium]
MTRPLINLIMPDGSRHFGDLPQTALWYDVREHVERLPGATLTGFITDGVTEAWIDFTYQGYVFSINDQFGDYWFFVNDPACPDIILSVVMDHFADLLDQP